MQSIRLVMAGIALLTGSATVVAAESSKRPNVLVIITDDQGHGDLGLHGNPKIRTPNLDRLGRESTRFDRFYVSPVCAPTRASLLTGRYNYRTGAVDTYLGRAMMHPEETTLAEMLAAAGYRTAIFGKWHLGDNYPMRPIDQGFQEALVLRGGGLGQPSDVPGGGSYFNPVLQHNGRPERVRGYCSDVFTDAAIDYVSRDDARPFFAYLAFNCPHTPLEAAEKDVLPYTRMDLSNDQFPRLGHPLPREANKDETARVYGMVTNIDENLGRLFARLDERKLAENTIVVFLTDNGPQQVRYNSGMLDRKTSVHEGGIRVPCFVRWPGHFAANRVIDRIAAHIDITPTLLDACGVAPPQDVHLDGRSLLPLLNGAASSWADRTLFFQWHRGDVPELYRAFAARSQHDKLVRPEAARGSVERTLELYDMEADPFEMKNVAGAHPAIVQRMKGEYEAWFKDVSATRGYDPPRIVLGSDHENPSTLTRQDWRGSRASWEPQGLGHWEVRVERPGRYEVTLLFPPVDKPTTAHFELEGVSLDAQVPAGASEVKLPVSQWSAGPGRLEAWVVRGGQQVGVHYVDIFRRGD
ncbi:MAG: arylsulfatase [Isosphaeraceae bacterium]|nr:arylsulfatase [Isosphaeraceae bacterium]